MYCLGVMLSCFLNFLSKALTDRFASLANSVTLMFSAKRSCIALSGTPSSEWMSIADVPVEKGRVVPAMATTFPSLSNSGILVVVD